MILGGLLVFVVVIVLLGVYYPGSGLEQLGLKSARQIIETREELDAEDLDQMLSAHNARRRARGEDELTEAHLERRVMEDVEERRRWRERYLADAELDQPSAERGGASAERQVPDGRGSDAPPST